MGAVATAVAAVGTNLATAGYDRTAATDLDDIDTQIGNVSGARATLGASQNRFEHTINSLNVAVENLSASESRIRDTDMAQEMMNFTRSQILSQAGTAMLAQANQAPQSVLCCCADLQARLNQHPPGSPGGPGEPRPTRSIPSPHHPTEEPR